MSALPTRVCDFILGNPPGARCGAPAAPGRYQCQHHYDLCHLPRGSAEELRELKRFHILARSRVGRDVAHIIPPNF